jgi:dihydrofolate reductase
MGKTTCGISMSLDGFVAGPNQRFEMPFGDIDDTLLHHWMFDEPELHKRERDAILDAGAFIMGSNMFGSKDRRNLPEWKGWWGDDPPYHAPTFVLMHHKREPVPMEGGTTFYFVDDGIESAHRQAKEAAGDRNVAVMGGASTVNQFLAAGLIDELWLLSPR